MGMTNSASEPTALIRARGLTKVFGARTAVAGIDFEVREALKGEDQALLKEKGEALARLMSEIGTAAYQQGQAEGANGAESGEPTPASEETIEGEAKEV